MSQNKLFREGFEVYMVLQLWSFSVTHYSWQSASQMGTVRREAQSSTPGATGGARGGIRVRAQVCWLLTIFSLFSKPNYYKIPLISEMKGWGFPKSRYHKTDKFWSLRTSGANSCFDISRNDVSPVFTNTQLKELTLLDSQEVWTRVNDFLFNPL